MLYMVTFTINIPPMLAYIPYMDPMGKIIQSPVSGLRMSPDSGPPRNLRGWSSVVVVHRLGEAASPSRGLGETLGVTGVSTGMVFIGAPHDVTKEQARNPGDPSGMMWHWICSSRPCKTCGVEIGGGHRFLSRRQSRFPKAKLRCTCVKTQTIPT